MSPDYRLVTWWGGSGRRCPTGTPVCSHRTSLAALTELFTAQMERDPALFNSPTGPKTGKRTFLSLPLASCLKSTIFRFTARLHFDVGRGAAGGALKAAWRAVRVALLILLCHFQQKLSALLILSVWILAWPAFTDWKWLKISLISQILHDL